MSGFGRASAVIGCALLGACSGVITGGGSGPSGDDSPRNDVPPSLQIDEPSRGQVGPSGVVHVAGSAHDDEHLPVTLTINGTAVDVGPDGSFATDVGASPGVLFLETIATDPNGNQQRDVRAVLAGEQVDLSTPVEHGVVASVTRATVGTLEGQISNLAANTDFTPLALSLNPVVNTGDNCNGAKIYLDKVSHGAVPTTVTPVTGGLDAKVSITGLVVNGHVDFHVLCIAGTAQWTITASSYDVGGKIVPRIENGDIAISLDGQTGVFQGFNLSIVGVVDWITNIIEGNVKDQVSTMLRDAIAKMVPPMANSFLAGVLATSYTLQLFYRNLDLLVTPTEMEWTSDGGMISLTTTASLDGASGTYLRTTMPVPDLATMTAAGPNFRVALADDEINQVLAAYWLGGAFEYDIPIMAGDPIKSFFPSADQLTVHLSLPPVVDANTSTGDLRLAVGDVIATIIDKDEGLGTIAELAISTDMPVQVGLGGDGAISFTTGEPRILAQVVDQSASLVLKVDDARAAAFAGIGVKQTKANIDDLLRQIPIPSFPGVTLSVPSSEPKGGYLILGVGTGSAP